MTLVTDLLMVLVLLVGAGALLFLRSHDPETFAKLRGAMRDRRAPSIVDQVPPRFRTVAIVIRAIVVVVMVIGAAFAIFVLTHLPGWT